MTDAVRVGRVVSFYSFKGGVGRTMALANVAFLAAMNGLNVLVMDWDLEAPGLHHYFRGLMEAEDMGRLREAPGVLDLAWDWRTSIEAAADREAVDAVFANFRSGTPFETHLIDVFPFEHLEHGRIDMIPAGGRIIKTPEPVEYERALAAFSWNDFLDRFTGGGMLDALRNWAVENYDLVLIDSRTGLADVAGICTTQLPDAVVLAFVLNRQNIEGVSRVAGAIREARGDAVKMWPVPMRVSREGTAEEADASARALRELVRFGGFEREQVERDMRGLLIKAEPNVPFMESLAPFNDTDSALDPLTANLARLTREITGIEIEIPAISDRWRDSVQMRLAPALSTESYLRQLLTAEPTRAARELHRYVESALTTLADNEPIADDYVAALVETSIAIQQRGDDPIILDSADTSARVNLLLRKLYENDNDRWRRPLIDALQTSLDASSDLYYHEDEAVALEEIDELLAHEPISVSVLSRRAETRLRISRLYAAMSDTTQQLSAAEDALIHLAKARKEPGGDSEDLQLLRYEAMVQKAAALEALDQPDEAEETLRKVVSATDAIISMTGRSDAVRLSFDANYRLMMLAKQRDAPPKETAQHARAAIARSLPGTVLFLSRMSDLGEAIIAGPAPGADALELIRRTVARNTPSSAAQFFSRAPRAAAAFISVLGNLLQSAREEIGRSIDGAAVTEAAVDIVREVFGTAERRLAIPSMRLSGSRSQRQSIAMAPVLAEVVTHFATIVRSFSPDDLMEHTLNELDSSAVDLAQRANEYIAEQVRRDRPRT